MFLTREIVKYVEYLKMHGYTARTQESYQDSLKLFQRYLETENILKIHEITRKVILNYQMYLMNRPPVLSIDTQRQNLMILRGFMKYLVKTDQLLFNPASELELPRRRKRLPQGIMSVKEVRKLLNQPDTNDRLGLRDRAMLEVLYSTAVRNQELRNLRLKNVDLKEQTIRIVGGKGGKDRLLPLGKKASEYLEQYIQNIRPTLIKSEEEQILFLGYRKTPLSRNTVSNMVRGYAEKVGIKKHITTHSLRHSCATHMLKNRASLRHIQELLGHSSLETTQKYTRIEITDLKQAHRKYHPLER